DDDRRGRRRSAAEPDRRPHRAGGDDHRVHRPGQPRRPAARQHRLPVDLRRRRGAVRDHPAVQPGRPPPAPALPRGLLMRSLQQTIALRRRQDRVFHVLGALCTAAGVLVFGALLADLLWHGFARIDWAFVTSYPSRIAERAGILAALQGSLAVMVVTAAVAVPLGVAAGVYLEEYAPKNRLTAIIEINIANLAGVPSVIYGLMALGVLVYVFGLGPT